MVHNGFVCWKVISICIALLRSPHGLGGDQTKHSIKRLNFGTTSILHLILLLNYSLLFLFCRLEYMPRS